MIDRSHLFDALLPAVFAASAIATAVITLAVVSGRTGSLDRRFFALTHRRPSRPDEAPRLATTAARDVVALGGDVVRAIFLAGCLLGLIAAGRREAAAALLVICLSGRAAIFLAKAMLRRPRPDFTEADLASVTTSFPSGHSFMSVVVYLSAALLIPQSAALVALAAGYALLLSFLIGLNRMVFGAHWPSDVAAGWLGGLAWVSGALLLY
jgi:undecaprenyl-diphosphatase